eukprot:SM000004S15000  [mRNA]  locus=s4:677103:682063:+ [translate_table: standard]
MSSNVHSCCPCAAPAPAPEVVPPPPLCPPANGSCVVGSGCYGSDCSVECICLNGATCFDGPSGNGTCDCSTAGPGYFSGTFCNNCAANYDFLTGCTQGMMQGSPLLAMFCCFLVPAVCLNGASCDDGTNGSGVCNCSTAGPGHFTGTFCQNCADNYDFTTGCTTGWPSTYY